MATDLSDTVTGLDRWYAAGTVMYKVNDPGQTLLRNFRERFSVSGMAFSSSDIDMPEEFAASHLAHRRIDMVDDQASVRQAILLLPVDYSRGSG